MNTRSLSWLLGGIGVILTTVLAAWVGGAPGWAIEKIEAHYQYEYDKRYVQIADNSKQLYQMQINDFNTEMRTLKFRQTLVESDEAKNLVQEQIDEVEEEKEQYERLNAPTPPTQ